MRAPASRLLSKILVLLALVAFAFQCPAYTYIQVGVDSNFLIDSNRVLFAQADGSLTVLSLANGDVLQRQKNRNYSGTLVRTERGVLVLNSGSAALLDPTHFNLLWEAESQFEPNVSGDALIAYDGAGFVQCRSLNDGRVRWTYDMPGILEIVAVAGKVLVHHSAVYEEGSPPATALLELATGRELFRKMPPFGTNWVSTFFDGTNIYVETGPFNGKRSDYKPEWLATWNLRGQETGRIPIPAEVRDRVRFRQVFDLDQKTFWRGHVYTSQQAIPYEKQSGPVAVSAQTNRLWKTFESDYDLGNGIAFTERVRDRSGTNGTAYVMEIEWRTDTNHWKGVLSYLLNRGRISAIAVADGRLLIGTDLGHVECIDAATGESLWLYLFPTLHRTMSSSAQGLPPTVSEAAAIFRDENSRRPTSGLQVVGGKAQQPKIIVDPQPANPFRNLPRLLAIAWGGACLPLAILLGFHVAPRSRRWGSPALGSIVAWIALMLCALNAYYGRISPGSSTAFKIALAIAFAFGLIHTANAFRRGKVFLGSVLVLLFAGVGLLLL